MLLCFHDIHSKFQKSCHCSIFETKGYHTMPNNSPFIIGGIQPRVTISVIAISNSLIVTPNFLLKLYFHNQMTSVKRSTNCKEVLYFECYPWDMLIDLFPSFIKRWQFIPIYSTDFSSASTCSSK